jgi:hypothetical protein
MNVKLLAAIIALFSAYFPAAFYLKSTYVPPPDAQRVYWLPYPPFPHVGGIDEGHAYLAWLDPTFDALGDNDEHPTQSPLELFEDGKPLGPAHSSLEDIKSLGGGRYSHRKGVGLIFSPSDNGDPNAPWRKYYVQPTLKDK